MCRLIAYKNKQMRNKGSYHVWSILQKFRGFKLICKYYFMHKVKKKANIIIEMNKPISWVKSTIYDGLNKQPNLLGKINPKCTLLPSSNWVVFNPVFFRVCRVFFNIVLREIKADGRKRHSILLSFYKKCSELNNKMRLGFFSLSCSL